MLAAIAIAVAPAVRAQEEDATVRNESGAESPTEHGESEDVGEHESGPFKRHRIAFLTGNTIVPSGGENEDRIGTVVVPTVAIDYEYWFSRKLALGWYNDFTLSTFVVETNREPEEDHGAGAQSSDGGTEVVEREPTFLTALVIIWEPVHRLAVYTGGGKEFETNEDFWVWKIGLEYSFPLPKDWDIAIGGAYDYKDVYDSFGVGISFGKRFGKPR
jgi:hypothetical protein